MNQGKASGYLQKVDAFLVDLLILVYMTSGAPARGTEISQIQWLNTSNSQRSLFLDPATHQFFVKLRYAKTFSYTNIERDAARALPSCLSYVLLFYIVVVLPFRRFLMAKLGLKIRPELVFWKGDSAVPSNVLSSQLQLQTTRYLDQQLGIASWRQLAQGFIRYSMQEQILDDPDSVTDNDLDSNEILGAGQMHHSRDTGLLVYGRHIHQLANITSTVQSRYIAFSQRWHDFIGLGQDFTQFGDIYPTIPLPLAQPTWSEMALAGKRISHFHLTSISLPSHIYILIRL